MNPNVNTPTLAELQSAARKGWVDSIRDHFCARRTRKAAGGKPAFQLVVNDWSALELLISDASDADHNPTAQFNEALIPEAQSALAAHDADTLGECLLLMLKAVRRG